VFHAHARGSGFNAKVSGTIIKLVFSLKGPRRNARLFAIQTIAKDLCIVMLVEN